MVQISYKFLLLLLLPLATDMWFYVNCFLCTSTLTFLFWGFADPFSMAPPKALETIGKNLSAQYERWQPRVRMLLDCKCSYNFVLDLILFTLKIYEQARYKVQPDPTVDEVKKLCNTCRRYAKSERVLFHYNGHGVPKPTSNGEIWVFNKVFCCFEAFLCALN